MKVLVLLPGNRDVERWREEFRAGRAPDETPYGYHFADGPQCKITFSRPSRNSLTSRVARKLLGFDLFHVVHNWDLVTAADVVWTAREREYLGVLFISWLRWWASPTKIIAQSIFLFEEWNSRFFLYRILYLRLLKRASILTVHSEKYIDVARAIVPGGDVRMLYFGVSTETFPITPYREDRPDGPIRIFAVGNDPRRDWWTLVEAFGNDDRFEVVIATTQSKPEQFSAFRNVSLPAIKSMPEFLHYYRSADFAVVPQVENRYAGITVALEAVALGVPVISSNTGSVPSYFSSEEVIYVPPQDAAALLNAALTTDRVARREIVFRAQKRFIERDYSTRGHALRHVAMSREILGLSALEHTPIVWKAAGPEQGT